MPNGAQAPERTPGVRPGDVDQVCRRLVPPGPATSLPDPLPRRDDCHQVVKHYRAEDVDELTQELALDLAEHAAAYDPERGMPTTWAAIRFRATYARWQRRTRHPGGVTHVAPGRLRVMSLDAPLYPDDVDRTLGDRLAAPTGPIGRLDGMRLDQAMTTLQPREREALERRTGWGGTAPIRLQDIADEWHCSRQRVHQIETRGLTRLRRALDVPEPATSPRRVPVRRAA